MLTFPGRAIQHILRGQRGEQGGMIEIIREEERGGTTERHGLPKDIKQMGKPDIGDRIYVENEVYRFLHPYSSVEEKRAYVLLGRFENYAGQACVFVESAICLEEIAFDGELPLWNDGIWAYIYKQLRKEYDDMVIVGWAMDIKGQLPNMTIRLEALHQSHFGGAHQLLFLMDSLECEEAFYGNKNEHLYRREGFYVYYEKKEAAYIPKKDLPYEREEELERGAADEEPQVSAPMTGDVGQEALPKGNYRRQVMEAEEPRGLSAYVSTVMLALVVCVLGVSAYWNNEKMNSMEATLAQMNQMQNVAAETEEFEVNVENVVGNVPKQGETSEASMENEAETQVTGANADASATTTMPETDIPAAATMQGANTAAEAATLPTDTAATAGIDTVTAPAEATTVLTEAQTYLNQGYYVVQKGDSLVGICKKIYQTTAMMDKLCEVNGIDNQDEIYAGQKLILPN